MGDYSPPPFGIIQLAAYLERHVENLQLEVLDCNVEKVDWAQMEKRIAASSPDVVCSSSLATCNTYAVAKTLETAKRINPRVLTVTGGQHFTATAKESLEAYPEIDAVVRGEGEQTLTELVKCSIEKKPFSQVAGLSFRRGKEIFSNPSRPLIENLEALPFPGYHLVQDFMGKYHFRAMAAPNSPYALVEGSRGCSHECTFCSQWRHWQACWRAKSAKRTAAEMKYCYERFGSKLIWLTDDNFGAGNRPKELAEEIVGQELDDLAWFVQARCDDIVRNEDILPKLRESGLSWVLLGVENSSPSTLESFKKGITPDNAKAAVKLLKDNGIFAHAMLIIGQRKDTRESIAKLREFANELDPDFLMFGILTPFPGTEVYEEASRNGWIMDKNWSHYDMIHAIMPTETLSANEVQEQLYECYRDFYGSWSRRFSGIFSSNMIKRQVFWQMLRKGVMGKVKSLF
jgi:anaerobic magnesium-protoporphyrin IX monomethyl ester cyclase